MATSLVLTAVALGGGLCVVVFAWGWVLAKTDPPVPRYLVRTPVRRRTSLPKTQAGPLTGLFEAVGRPFREPLRSVLGPDRLSRARHRIGAAGLTNALTPDVYLVRRAGAIVLFGVSGVLFCLLQWWFVAVVFIVLGQVWVDGQLWLLARRRSDEIERKLPDFLDVLAVTVSAGLGFRRALARVTESMPGALAEEFSIAIHQMDLGTSRRDAFGQLKARNRSPSLNRFLTAVLQAEELGSPLSEALVEIATDMRQNTAQVARRRAARVAPRIQLVVTFLLVPGALILFIGSILITLFGEGGIGVFG